MPGRIGCAIHPGASKLTLAKVSNPRTSGVPFLMWAVEALKEWHDFYILLGTAGDPARPAVRCRFARCGLLDQESQSATRTFMSPVIVHFTTVFFLSCIALFPSHQAKLLAALIGATALIGAIISTYITIQSCAPT